MSKELHDGALAFAVECPSGEYTHMVFPDYLSAQSYAVSVEQDQPDEEFVAEVMPLFPKTESQVTQRHERNDVSDPLFIVGSNGMVLKEEISAVVHVWDAEDGTHKWDFVLKSGQRVLLEDTGRNWNVSGQITSMQL